MMTNTGNRMTQGTFSFLPDLTDAQITKQIDYASSSGWAVGVEYTDDPHPRNTYWEMFGNPMFDLNDAAGILMEINACRKTFPSHYMRVTAFDSTHGIGDRVVLSFIVNRPAKEPGFGLSAREEAAGRRSATASRATRRRRARRRSATERRRRAHGRRWTLAVSRPSGDARSLGRARRCSTSSTPSWSGWRR